MTNEEKLYQIFPDGICPFSKVWLSEEYREPTTKNNLGVDCISRADVNRLICEYRDDATETGNERDLERAYGANAVGELISELPSVTPQEPRKGHWIADVDRWGDLVTTVNGYRCDKCNTFNADKDNYCPNCGAKMESEVDNGKDN